jgi:hypothetical protein
MSVESTLGGLALAADGSSWPTRIQGVLEIIENLKSGGEPDPTKLGEILGAMAIGIAEAHVCLECIFIATMPFAEDVSHPLWTSITEFREDVAIDTQATFAEVKRRLTLLSEVHQMVTAVRGSVIEGTSLMDQATLSRNLLQILANFAKANPAV